MRVLKIHWVSIIVIIVLCLLFIVPVVVNSGMYELEPVRRFYGAVVASCWVCNPMSRTPGFFCSSFRCQGFRDAIFFFLSIPIMISLVYSVLCIRFECIREQANRDNVPSDIKSTARRYR